MMRHLAEAGSVIGVATLFDLEVLKRSLLLVDKIAVLHNEDPETDWYCRNRNPGLAADLDWLSDKGLVERVESSVQIESVDDLRARINFKPSGECPLTEMSKVPESLLRSSAVTEGGRPAFEAACDLCCRVLREQLMLGHVIDAVSLRDPTSSLPALAVSPLKLGSVQELVIEQFPYPSESTSLEQILEFRSDPDSQRRLVSLRRWASRFGANADTVEVAQELQYLISEYENHMKVHEMKIMRGIWQTVVVTTAESIEHLVKLKFGKLAKSFFAISSRKIELLEAELKAPGREIAYVSRARKQFGTLTQ